MTPARWWETGRRRRRRQLEESRLHEPPTTAPLKHSRLSSGGLVPTEMVSQCAGVPARDFPPPPSTLQDTPVFFKAATENFEGTKV